MLSVAMIARNNYVTPSVVTSVLDSISWEHPSQLPETLCVDEFKGSSGVWDSEKSRWDITKYHCNISDGEAGIIIDILPRITAEHLKGYFHKFSSEQRKRVKYYCCDMHNGFISVARELFPDANICIDMFHVVKLLNDTVESIRRRLQRDMEEQQNKESHRILKNVSRSLLTSEIKQERLANPNNAKRREKLKVVFDLFPDLAEAYDALQEFHAINNTPLLILQKSNLTDWIIRNCDSTVPELEKTARSIRHWRGYIQNTWEYHRSNSTCEGLNNKIKVLKRVSFGLHCFETFRKRVLLTCGYLRLSNDPFTIFNEKRKGKGIKL
jgi:transposase